MAGLSYDRKALLSALADWDAESNHADLSALAFADGTIAREWRDVVLEWALQVINRVIQGELADLGVFPSLALTQRSPETDARRRVLAFGLTKLKELEKAHLIRVMDAPLQAPSAFQIVVRPPVTEARLNGAIRGCLIAVLWQPEKQKVPKMELLWELQKSERSETTHITVINGPAGDRNGCLVFDNLLPSIIRTASPERLQRLLYRSIRVPGARRRWRGVRPNIDPEEIRTELYEAWEAGIHRAALGTHIVDALERSAGAGMPSRKSDLERVSTDDSSKEETLPPLESAGPEEQLGAIDLQEAMEGLDPDMQVILRRWSMGEADEEIAQDFGITQQAINRKRLAAFKVLRKRLSP